MSIIENLTFYNFFLQVEKKTKNKTLNTKTIF